jgi:hypothetical protein
MMQDKTREDIAWSALRSATESLPRRMLDFAYEHYGQDVVEEAWEDFMMWDVTDPLSEESPQFSTFLSWLHYQWSPDASASEISDTSLLAIPPALAFLQKEGHTLSDVARDYVTAALAAPFSFQEIIHVDSGRGFRVRDFFTHEELEVQDRHVSSKVKEGDLLYAMLISMSGITVVEASGGHVLPPSSRDELNSILGDPEYQAITFGDTPEAQEERLRGLYLILVDKLGSVR